MRKLIVLIISYIILIACDGQEFYCGDGENKKTIVYVKKTTEILFLKFQDENSKEIKQIELTHENNIFENELHELLNSSIIKKITLEWSESHKKLFFEKNENNNYKNILNLNNYDYSYHESCNNGTWTFEITQEHYDAAIPYD